MAHKEEKVNTPTKPETVEKTAKVSLIQTLSAELVVAKAAAYDALVATEAARSKLDQVNKEIIRLRNEIADATRN